MPNIFESIRVRIFNQLTTSPPLFCPPIGVGVRGVGVTSNETPSSNIIGRQASVIHVVGPWYNSRVG